MVPVSSAPAGFPHLGKLGGGDGPQEKRDVLAILPEELWCYLMERIEDPADFANFARVSSFFQCLAEPMIGERLLDVVYPYINVMVGQTDFYNLRLVSRKCKKIVDRHHMSKPKGNCRSVYPVIYLETVAHVRRFAQDISGPSTDPFPFEVRCLPPLDFQQLFWQEFAIATQAIGHRFSALVLNAPFDDKSHDEFLAEDVMRLVITGCLAQMPNLEFLLLHTQHGFLEQAVTTMYTDADPLLPRLTKLRQLEIVTFSTEHHDCATDYPACLLRAHGGTLKSLTLNLNCFQLQSLNSLPAIPNLEHLRYELVHCNCITPHPNPHYLEHLEKANVPGTSSLKTLAFKLNWQWRPMDIYHLFQWLNERYVGCNLERLSVQTYDLEEFFLYLNVHPEWQQGQGHHALQYRDVYNHSNDKQFSWSWLSDLKLPFVSHLQILADYQGSWEFLRPFRHCVKELTMIKPNTYDVLTADFIRKNNIDCSRSCDGSGSNPKIFQSFNQLEKLVLLYRDRDNFHQRYKYVFTRKEVELQNMGDWAWILEQPWGLYLKVLLAVFGLVWALWNEN